MAHIVRYLIAAILAGYGTLTLAGTPREIRFRAFAAELESSLGFAPAPGAASTPLEFYPTALSREYAWLENGRLDFVDIGGATRYSVEFPEAGNRFLVILVRGSSPLVLDDSESAWPRGTAIIVNLSGLSLTGLLRDRPLQIANGINPTIAVGRSADLVLRTTFKNRSLQVFAGHVTLEAGERALLLLLPPFRPGGLEPQSRLIVDPAAAPGNLPLKLPQIHQGE